MRDLSNESFRRPIVLGAGGTPRLLLIDNDQGHAERICGQLRFRAFEVDVYRDPERARTRLRRASTKYEVVIVNVSDTAMPWFKTLLKLQEACFQLGSYPSPLFLCTSSIKQSSEFELQIERMGARYVVER